MKEVDTLKEGFIYSIDESSYDEETLIDYCVDTNTQPSSLDIEICEPIYGEIDLEDTLIAVYCIESSDKEFSKETKEKIVELEKLLAKEIIGYEEIAVPSKWHLEMLDTLFNTQKAKRSKT